MSDIFLPLNVNFQSHNTKVSKGEFYSFTLNAFKELITKKRNETNDKCLPTLWFDYVKETVLQCIGSHPRLIKSKRVNRIWGKRANCNINRRQTKEHLLGTCCNKNSISFICWIRRWWTWNFSIYKSWLCQKLFCSYMYLKFKRLESHWVLV